MVTIPESVKRQIAKPRPDVAQFVAVLTGRRRPQRVHLAELFADNEIMQWVTENVLRQTWVPAPARPDDREQMRQHLLCQIEYWYRLGYDYIRVIGGVEFPAQLAVADNTADLAREKRHWTSHAGPIQSWADFKRYPWVTITDESVWHYQFVAEHLPAGMGLLVCPHSGFLEVPMNILVGYEPLALMIYDQPDLVRAIFDAVRERIVEVCRRTITIPQVTGFFQGDDMGFRSGTLFAQDFLKTHSLTGHRQLAEMAHQHGKIYMLHSCGNLAGIMDYLIDDIGIDARHSYEDAIMPVEEFFRQFGRRVGVLGGLDVNLLGGADEPAVRRRARAILDGCAGGRYAFGTGNSVANYCKPENVLAMWDEAYMWG
jgi:uroporphyrinogen decarboxylase